MPGRIGKYTVERELGQGGFGRVYLAFDPDVGQPVAIKKLLAQGDPDLLKRFQLEIRTTASLRHKNIVTIHASGEEAGDPYLVMEFLEGHTLKQIIRDRRPLNLLEKVRIMTQVADGLAYAHSKGVVHRDVKPENIMVLPDDTVKIMDFGIALAPNRNTAVTQTGGIIGTPSYFAPEQLEGLKANEQSDIFSFGDVYYELLTGVHPFEQYKNDWRTLQIAIISYEPRVVSELVSEGCPEALETLVHRTLAKEPELRYRKFEEIQLDSEAILVDLRHEGAAGLVRQVASLMRSGDLETAVSKINQAYQLDPGNREIRRVREEINLQIKKEQMEKRIAKLLEDAEKQMTERRYAEAVQALESAAKLNSADQRVIELLEVARGRMDCYARANRLVAEARLEQQKGSLDEAENRLKEALEIDPDHTDARRLSNRVHEQLVRRRQDRKRQEAIAAARELLAAKRFNDAKEVVDRAEAELTVADGLAELRAEIQREQAEADRRKAEKFRLAIVKTGETMQAGDLVLAQQMLDHLNANFAAEPGAQELLAGLGKRLEALVRAREIAQYDEKARSLLQENSFQEVLDTLTEALEKYAGDADLTQLKQLAEERHQAQQRAEAIAAVLKEAIARRDAGDVQGALDSIVKGRRDLGDETAFVDLASQFEVEIENQRYRTALDDLLKDGRDLILAGRYSELIDRLERALEFNAEPEVNALRDSALAGAAAEEERRFVKEILTAAGKLESAEQAPALAQALTTVESGLAHYPQNRNLLQAAMRLRESAEREAMRAAVERRRAAICLEIGNGDWKRAEAAVREARAEFPGNRTFDDLAEEVASAIYRDGWREMEARINRHLATGAPNMAERELEDQATRTIYSSDPRWMGLVQEVVRRKDYEEALAEADRQRAEERFSEAEHLLTEVINQGPPDQRAHQMRRATREQRSEASRQRETARIAQEIREHLDRGDLALAESQLAAGRARYPGESVWEELQCALGEIRRKAEIAAAEDDVGRFLSHGDIQSAAARLADARVKFPGEAVWLALDDEIKRKSEIAAAAEGIRRLIRDRAGGSFTGSGLALLEQRRDDLRQAVAGLDEARVTHPGEPLWNQLQAEIDARDSFLDAEQAIAERLTRRLETGEILNARSQLALAREQYPDAFLWGIFADQVDRREELLKRHADVARISSAVQERLNAHDLRSAAEQLASGLAKYPHEEIWERLQQQIDARQAALLREAEIANIAESIRTQPDREIRKALSLELEEPSGTQAWNALQSANTRLDRACGEYPDEPLWETLRSEIAERRIQFERDCEASIRKCIAADDLEGALSRLNSAKKGHPGLRLWDELQIEVDALAARLQRREDLNAVERSVREQMDRVARIPLERDCRNPIELQWEAFRTAAAIVSEAQTKYPDDQRLAELLVEAGARRKEWHEQVRSRLADALRGHLSQESAKWFGSQIRTLGSKEPGEPLWEQLEQEIAALETLLARQAETAAAAESIRELLELGDISQAAARLDAARARYSGDPLWEKLQAELTARRSEIEEALGRVEALLAEERPEDAIHLIEGRFAKVISFAEPLNRVHRTLEEKRRREDRNRVHGQLLALERQSETEPRKRKRKELDREAQRIAAAYREDQELAALAAQIHAHVEPSRTEPAAQRAIPQKVIWGAVGAVAVAGLLMILTHGKRTPAPPKPLPIAHVPIEIRSDPPGAVVRLGDRSCKTPNCQFDLTPGNYSLDAQLDGYVEQRQTLTADSANRVYNITLEPLPPPSPPGLAAPETGTLLVQTGVSGALVYVDGTARSRTGQSGSVTLSLDAKTHELRVERNGYEKAAAQQVKIKAAAQQTVLFRLAPVPAKLRLDGAPAGAEARIAGASLGRTDGSAAFVFPTTIAPGNQALEIALGSAKRTLQQHFEPGQTARLNWGDVMPSAPLAPPPPPKPSAEEVESRDWDRVKTTAGLSQLRAFLQTHANGAHADQAKSRIAELLWAAVDKANIDAIRQFLRENPNSPHRADAQSILDQFDARAKAESAKQDLVKQESERLAAQEKLSRRQIHDAISSLNSAIQRNKPAEVKKIWHDVSPDIIETMRTPRAGMSFNDPKEQDIQFPAPDQATVICELVTKMAQKSTSTRFTFIFRNSGAGWIVESAHAN